MLYNVHVDSAASTELSFERNGLTIESREVDRDVCVREALCGQLATLLQRIDSQQPRRPRAGGAED